MAKQRVLFVCIHNSARSQMAEAWLKHLCSESYDVQSAGIEPGTLNPLVVEVLREVGIDISANRTQSVMDLLKRKESFDYVITVCDESSAQKCPVFPGVTKRLHWGFPDPSKISGPREEKLSHIRIIRDDIKLKVENWCLQTCASTT